MFVTLSLAGAASLALLQPVLGSDFKFCTESTCDKNCPARITSSGTGYPNCVVYNTEDIFPGLGFSGSEGGGYKLWLDVTEPDEGCRVIVKSPANLDVDACGYTIASYSHATCSNVALKKTFMVQHCCGDTCKEAGVTRSVKFSGAFLGARSGVGRGVYLQYENGTIITPFQGGIPPELAEREIFTITPPEQPEASKGDVLELAKRKGNCNGDWNADSSSTKSYTRPANNVQILTPSDVVGPATLSLTKTRTQSWTQSSGMNLGVADILSLGASITQEETTEKSDSSEIQFTVDEGQIGQVGFTSTLRCTKGTGTCNDKKVHGEICVPVYKDKQLVGTTAFISH